MNCPGHTWTDIVENNLARAVIVGDERLPDQLDCAEHDAPLVMLPYHPSQLVVAE